MKNSNNSEICPAECENVTLQVSISDLPKDSIYLTYVNVIRYTVLHYLIIVSDIYNSLNSFKL